MSDCTKTLYILIHLLPLNLTAGLRTGRAATCTDAELFPALGSYKGPPKTPR